MLRKCGALKTDFLQLAGSSFSGTSGGDRVGAVFCTSSSSDAHHVLFHCHELSDLVQSSDRDSAPLVRQSFPVYSPLLTATGVWLPPLAAHQSATAGALAHFADYPVCLLA